MTNKHIKRCLTLLIIGERQIKTAVRYNLYTTKMAIIKNIKQDQVWWLMPIILATRQVD
jgi:hypothetical protein